MTILFAFPGNETLAAAYAREKGVTLGKMEIHRFPDKESLIRIDTDVKGMDVTLMCSLDRPDSKAMSLLFFARTARELGAKSLNLIAPYLGYMRQDKRFRKGEAITADIFAAFLSQNFDGLITVDPHLHRHKEMGEIYSIPTKVVHASDAIAKWINENIDKPVLVGPDEESYQWVRTVADNIQAPYLILEKTRHGDRNVQISAPDIGLYGNHTPVLVDDIISTATTMVRTIRKLLEKGAKNPVCIGVHAVFSGDSFLSLKNSGACDIITCNTIMHETNRIDIAPYLGCIK